MNKEFWAVFTLRTLKHPFAGFTLFPMSRQWSFLPLILCMYSFYFFWPSKIVPFISGFHLLILGPGARSYLFCLVLWMLSITPFLLQ